MISRQDYQNMKEKDMEKAMGYVKTIQESKDPSVRYKDSRPITDIKNMVETSAEKYGENTAFMVKDKKGVPYRHIKYKEALEDMNALGTFLVASGLKGKRIAVIGENCYEWAISYLAVICGVGVVVPLDKELNENELKQLIIRAEVSCVIFSSKYEKKFVDMKNNGETGLETLINMNAEDNVQEILSLKQLIVAGKNLMLTGNKEFLEAQINSEEMSIILFTSGTTGVSKGVMLSHANLVADLMVSPTVLAVHPTDIFFSVLPLHHTYECTCGFLMPLYKGAAIAYCEGLKYITKNLQEASPTMFLGVPVIFESMYKKIWQNVNKQGKEKLLRNIIKINRVTRKIGIDLGNIFFKDIRKVFGGRMRMMICGGAAINPEVLEGIQDFGITALQGYGLTECAPMGALNPDTAPKAASVGKAFPGFDAKIENKNEEGVGEICLKGGNVMLGYYQMQEETAKVIKDGWFYTGDLGYIDEEGYIYITGRKKNVIITKNGKNVYPEELEYYLSNSPVVSESMVFATDSQDGTDTLIVAAIRVDEEEVKAVLGDDYSEEQVEKLLWKEVDKINSQVPFFKRIKKVVLKKQDFEKNTSKKIKRFVESNKQ